MTSNRLSGANLAHLDYSVNTDRVRRCSTRGVRDETVSLPLCVDFHAAGERKAMRAFVDITDSNYARTMSWAALHAQVLPPTQTSFGTTAVLYKTEVPGSYARVIPTAAKIPEDQLVSTVLNPQFAANSVVLYPDTSSVTVGELTQPLPVSNVKATVSSWTAGKMSIALAGADTMPTHLLISENWYPDWHATIDGKPGVVRRADNTLLSVDLPVGARQVDLVFESSAYATGKMISLVALLVAIGMFAIPMVMGRKPKAA